MRLIRFFLPFAALISSTAPSFAEGDVQIGKGLFRNCKACHEVRDGTDIIIRGGKAGPNLFGVIGQLAAGAEKYSYSSGLVEAREAGLIWTPENFAGFVANPNVFLGEATGLDIRSKMPFAFAEGGEHIAAFLVSLQSE